MLEWRYIHKVNIEYGYSSNYCWWNSSSSSNLIENRVIEKEPDYYWSISTASGERPSAVGSYSGSTCLSPDIRFSSILQLFLSILSVLLNEFRREMSATIFLGSYRYLMLLSSVKSLSGSSDERRYLLPLIGYTLLWLVFLLLYFLKLCVLVSLLLAP